MNYQLNALCSEQILGCFIFWLLPPCGHMLNIYIYIYAVSSAALNVCDIKQVLHQNVCPLQSLNIRINLTIQFIPI